MRDFETSSRLNDENHGFDSITEDLQFDSDLVAEEILNNVNSTPLGQVLKRLAVMPEIRRGKVMNVRRKLTKGRYDLDEHLDTVLDRVLEDLTA